MILGTCVDAAICAVVSGRVVSINRLRQILPFQSDEFQSHMIAVGNRVFLRRCCHSFFSHGELCHFIAPSFESSMLACTSVHRPDDDVLLSFPFLLDGIHKFLGRPIRKSVAICNLSAEVKSSKGGHITSGVIFVVRPVCWSDLTFKQNCLGGSDRRPMEKRPGVILVIFEERWHLEVTGLWKWKDECKHVSGR